MRYFFEQLDGVNSDLKRHKKEEEYLKGKIVELENADDDLSKSRLTVYRHLLTNLEKSKVSVADKIGRK